MAYRIHEVLLARMAGQDHIANGFMDSDLILAGEPGRDEAAQFLVR